MEETQYQIRKAEEREALPAIDLLPSISHQGRQLDMALFGPNNYRKNVAHMQKRHFHSQQLPDITFTPATTAESISAVAYNFADFAKPQIFDSRWLQAGRIIRAQEGVFVNPLNDSQGNPITDEKTLKSLLKADRKVNGIYLLNNDSGFAPYDSFTRGLQDCDTFVQGGLARVLVHTPEEEAKLLRAIASPEFYKRGVNVWGFEPVKEPALRVVSLNSDRSLDDGRLSVDGNYWDYYNDGYAFGVLNRSAEGASPKK